MCVCVCVCVCWFDFDALAQEIAYKRTKEPISYVPMLQARYRSFVELDNFVGLVHLNWFMKERSSLHLIMPVLCDATQNKATSQNYNGLKTTLLELLLETLIMSISEVLIYYMSSTGHQLKRDVIILHR